MFLWFHIMACSLYKICSLDAGKIDDNGKILTWYPPLDWMNYVDSTLFGDAMGTLHKYLTCLYHAVLMIGNNEMGPVNESDILFNILALLFSSLLNANIFGEMAVLITALEQKTKNYQEKLDLANTAMKNIFIPPDLQDDVREYLQKTQQTRDNQEEFDLFLELIAPSLKNRV